MLKKLINFVIYGCYSKEEFEFVKVEREKYNHSVWLFASKVGTSAYLITFILSFIFEFLFKQRLFLGCLFALSLSCYYILNKPLKPTSKTLLSLIYVLIGLYLFYAIFVSIVIMPDNLSSTYQVLLILFACIVADKPWRLVCMELFFSILFIVACLTWKNPAVIFLETHNIILYTILAIITIYFMNCQRISSFNNAKKMEIASNTDELTKLNNRNAYEKDILNINNENNLVYISIDLNDLKRTNDSQGHLYGDELIINTSHCIQACFESLGNCYRIGGDEFALIVYADDTTLYNALNKFRDMTDHFTTEHTKGISVSLGYAKGRDFPYFNLTGLIKIADTRLYEDKERYYRTKGVDRRGQRVLLESISSIYKKIFDVNFTDDTFKMIVFDENERYIEGGFQSQISKWLNDFGHSKMVKEEDQEYFLEHTSLTYIKDCFEQGNRILKINYQRKFDDEYHLATLILVPKDNCSSNNLEFFLYVRMEEN